MKNKSGQNTPGTAWVWIQGKKKKKKEKVQCEAVQKHWWYLPYAQWDDVISSHHPLIYWCNQDGCKWHQSSLVHWVNVQCRTELGFCFEIWPLTQDQCDRMSWDTITYGQLEWNVQMSSINASKPRKTSNTFKAFTSSSIRVMVMALLSYTHCLWSHSSSVSWLRNRT